jgi:ABC-type oligopeptide transport system substrate-binding subunit
MTIRRKAVALTAAALALSLSLAACGKDETPSTSGTTSEVPAATSEAPADTIGGGTLTIGVNADGGHQEWAEALCNQWRNNLGLDCVVEATPDFATLRKGINARELTGMYRGGWQMDYPSIENFLTPIYATGASSNDGDFSDAQFDQLLKDAAAATDLDEANALYQQAEAILGEKMPTIPLWYQDSQFGWSENVESIKMTPFSTFDLGSVVLKSGDALSIRGCTPENPLIPTNTNEVCGGNVLDAVTARLVKYNPDDASPELDVAESIETEDSTVFTVTLKQGYMFQDGTEVKAKNFVDAWNWGAACANVQLNSYFFEPIEGFDDPEGEGCNAGQEMSGLAVTGDYTFTITTKSATSNLVVRLGYNAFSPQPDAFFADETEGKAEFAKLPVGAGPYKIVTNSQSEMVLEKFDGYSGDYPGAVQTVTFRIYDDTEAAYLDVVASNLDVTDVIPATKLMDDLWLSDLEGRNGTKSTGVIQVLTFSPIDENFDNIDLRRALSLGFDRELITTQIFAGARTPATGWVSPVVDGYKAGQCADCVFDLEKAKELYEAAGGYR